MDWPNIFIFVIIPILSVAIMFFAKRKLLWLAPLLSTTVAFVIYMAEMVITGGFSMISTIFSTVEYRGFLMIALLMNFGIAAALTAAAYIIVYIFKQKRK